MSDFLLELLSEEIPARMQAKARNDLSRLFAEGLQAAGLKTDGITTYSTPRRLALIARGLPASTEAVREEVKGPRTSAPPQALDGFLRKTGLSQEQLEDRDGVWFATIDRPGRATAEVLAELGAQIVRDFPWPKSMRWGDASTSTASLRWVRPLHSIVALLGEDIVPVEIEGVGASSGKVGTGFPSDGATTIKAGAATLGHRFHHSGPITIGGAHDYVEKLRACHVIVDQEEREAIVRDRTRQLADDAGFLLVEDEGLVVENAGLTEYPVPLLGSFDPDFLDVPEEVIQLTARLNQKYFVMRGRDEKLAPHFVCVANIDSKDGGEAIVAGNERVLAARLSDARFFWQQDLKVPLEEQARKLEQIVFHEKLGTVADKVERVAKLARWLVEEGIVAPAKAGASGRKGTANNPAGVPASAGTTRLADDAERAARLAKADLVTGMVGEFPELQGVIGGYLARAQGESDAVADAIRDHYKPVGQGDEVPTASVTLAVSLADKLDTLCGFFVIGEAPTGSKDPFALRRAAIAILRLLDANQLRMPITQTVVEAAHRHPIKPKELSDLKEDDRRFVGHWGAEVANDGHAIAGVLVSRDIAAFLGTRLFVALKTEGKRVDFVEASFSSLSNDFVALRARADALQAFVEGSQGSDLLAGYKRAANILKKEEGSWTPDQVRGDGEVLTEEKALTDAIDAAEPKARAAVEAEDFTAAMAALASLRAPIDAFFDKVTVNAEDAGVRARRLSLLARFRDAVHTVADFSKIEG